jgi:hypothetical protein
MIMFIRIRLRSSLLSGSGPHFIIYTDICFGSIVPGRVVPSINEFDGSGDCCGVGDHQV